MLLRKSENSLKKWRYLETFAHFEMIRDAPVSRPFLVSGFPEKAKIRKKLPTSDTIFLKRRYPRVSKNCRVKFFYYYQKE